MVSSGRSHRSAADNSWSTLRLDVVLTAASADEKGDTRGPEHTPQEKLLTSALEANSPRLKLLHVLKLNRKLRASGETAQWVSALTLKV